MFMHVKAISGVYYKRLLFTVLVIVVLAVVCYELTMNNGGDGGGSVFLEGVAYVEDESALKVAVDEAPSNMSAVVIALNNDISLKETLTIPIDKNITLISNRVTGFYRLIGPKSVATIDKPSSGLHVPGLVSSSGPTIVVETGGVLTLDGIIVTHARDCDGSGVIVSSGGTLILSKGGICDNTAADGGGGGVYNAGTFKMFGGEIFNNVARSGGVCNYGTFSMFGGVISGNTADYYGGGVYTAPWGLGRSYFFERVDGKIFGNTATMDGNDVFPEGSGGGGGGSSSGGDGETSDGNGDGADGSSDGNGDGGVNSGQNNGDSSGEWGVFGLRDVVFIGVGVAVVVVGVVVAVLLFTYKKELEFTKGKKER